MSRGTKKKVKKAAAEVERLQAELAKAKDAVAGGSGKKGKKKKKGRKKLLLVLIVGGALVASEDLRSKLLDALFGAEEEFQYTPPAPAGEGPAAA
jgi:hypothetical protein